MNIDQYKNRSYKFQLITANKEILIVDDFYVGDAVKYDKASAMIYLVGDAKESITEKGYDAFLKKSESIIQHKPNFVFTLSIHKDYFAKMKTHSYKGRLPMLNLKHLNPWNVTNWDVAHQVYLLHEFDIIK